MSENLGGVDSVSAAREFGVSSIAPTGTVTLLFTDIEGSTARWERNPSGMQDAIRRHDHIVRTVVERQRGYVFKTIGDAFCVAFARPEDALVAAVEVQFALDAEDFGAVGGIRVRMAVHSGTAHERDGDYFGPPVNRVARLLAAGHGGQILVSGVTSELARDRLTSGLRFSDLGVYRLKDLDRPEHIHQLNSAARETVFPPLRTPDEVTNNLPSTLTSFVGRQREVADLAALLTQHRLVTIVGSGGIGKTRVAAQVAALQLEHFPAGVWFVELAPLVDGLLIPNTIAALVGIELASGGDAVGSLVAALKGKRLLLIFDNCEHLVDPAARVAAALVGGCPELCIVATSRQPLRIAGEYPYRMPTLSVPASADCRAMTVPRAMEFDGVRLFVERALALDARFELTDTSAVVVADICRRLDGIALAIELAAARVRILGPVPLRDRLDRRLKLLTGGGREKPPRQQTLRALIDWSFDLLDERERALLSRLGIFADGFTLEASAAVCADDEFDEFETLDLLASLADKSLIIAEVEREPPRYRLLESVRAYALMKLDETGARRAVAARHLAYYAALTAASESNYDRTHSDRSLFVLAPELDNVRAALKWATEGGDAPAGAKLLGASRQFWRRWSASAEGIERCERFAASGEFAAAPTARLWNTASFLAYKTGRTLVALQAAELAIPLAHASGDPGIAFDALLNHALALMFAGRTDDADADLCAADRVLNRAPAAVEHVRLIEARGILQSWREDYAAAASAFAELARLHRTNGNLEGEVQANSNLAECEHARGQTERAIAVVYATLPLAQTLGHYWHAFMLANLGGYLVAASRVAEALASARAAIALSTTDPGAPLVANALEHFALTLALGGDVERAAHLLGYCDATRASNGFRRQYTELITHARLRGILKAQDSAGHLDALLAAGAALSASAAVETALLAPAPS